MSENSPQGPSGQSSNNGSEGIVQPDNRVRPAPDNVSDLMIVSVNDPGVALQGLLDAFSKEFVGRFYPVGFPVKSI